MAPIQKVKPGDLITADLINAVIDELEKIPQTQDGINHMPSLFGKTLEEAFDIIEKSEVKLPFKKLKPPSEAVQVMDVSGMKFNMNASEDEVNEIMAQLKKEGRKIIVQDPAAGIPLKDQDTLRLVLSAAG